MVSGFWFKTGMRLKFKLILYFQISPYTYHLSLLGFSLFTVHYPPFTIHCSLAPDYCLLAPVFILPRSARMKTSRLK